MVGLAASALSEAGLPVPDSEYRDDGTEKPPTVQFMINTGGKRGLMLADNDSGVEPGLLLEALGEFIEADSWLDAYLFLTLHPELTSGLAFTLLDIYASQPDDPQMAHQAEVNLNVLNRARETGLLAAFAEADQTPAGEFGRLVRAKREIEPVLLGFNGLTRDEVWRRLDDSPWLGRDDDTYLLLARRAEGDSDEGRAVLADLSLMFERHARGETTPDAGDEDHGPGQDLASELEQAARSAADVDASQVAHAGEDLLGHGDERLSRFWRVDVARITAQCYLRTGEAADDAASLSRAEEILASVTTLPEAGSWQDVAVAVTRGQVAISLYEKTGDESALTEAARRLASVRQRVGRYRTYEPPILRVLASITTLQAERTGEAGLIRETIGLLEAAGRITPRTGMSWLVNQTALIRAFLWMAQGDQAVLPRCGRIISDLTRRFGTEPGIRGKVHEMAGRVASSRFRWTQDIADLDAAVQSYQAALKFPETSRADRAHLDNNLAFAFSRRYQATGDAGDLEQARQHGEAAVHAMPSEAPAAILARRNLAGVYSALGTGEHDSRAAELLRLDLRVQPDGPDRTIAALNLALLLFQTAFTERAGTKDTLAEAYAAYTQAMQNLDPELMPWESVEFGDQLGRLLLTPGIWEPAAVSFGRAIEGIEVLSRVIPANQWGAEVGQKLDRIVQLGAYCAGRAGYIEQAVSWLETHRTRAMRNALRLDTSTLTRLAAAGHDELARSYAARASEIRSYRRIQEGEDGHTFLRQRQRILHDQLTQLSQRIRAVPGFERFGLTPDVRDAYRAAAEGQLLYVAVTSLGGLGFAVDGTTRTISLTELPEIHADALTEHGNRYLAALDAYRTNPSDGSTLRAWLAELDKMRSWLWTALVEPLRDVLTASRPVTFIPSGLLGLLPVNAAENEHQRAIDMTDWRLAPSAQALLTARHSAARAHQTAALAVLDPQPTDFAPLRWTEVEGAALRAQSGPLTRLAGEDATTEAVLRAMPNHTMLHFACHGTAYLNRPMDSYLALAEHAKLTLQTLTDEGRLWGARMCFLSACDSGVAGTAAPQEVVALPSALIQLGAAAVIASQWPVNDAAAAVLALRFYQACSEGVPPATAFAYAQRWLRTATRSQISALLRSQADDVTGIGSLIADLPLVRLPFANVQDWAAFTYTGC